MQGRVAHTLNQFHSLYAGHKTMSEPWTQEAVERARHTRYSPWIHHYLLGWVTLGDYLLPLGFILFLVITSDFSQIVLKFCFFHPLWQVDKEADNMYVASHSTASHNGDPKMLSPLQMCSSLKFNKSVTTIYRTILSCWLGWWRKRPHSSYDLSTGGKKTLKADVHSYWQRFQRKPMWSRHRASISKLEPFSNGW